MGHGAAGALILMSLLPMSTWCAIITLLNQTTLGEAKVNSHILTVYVCVLYSVVCFVILLNHLLN